MNDALPQLSSETGSPQSCGKCKTTNPALSESYFDFVTDGSVIVSYFWECPGLITCDLFRLKALFYYYYVFLLTRNVLSCNSCTFRIEGVSGEVEFHTGFNLV